MTYSSLYALSALYMIRGVLGIIKYIHAHPEAATELLGASEHIADCFGNGHRSVLEMRGDLLCVAIITGLPTETAMQQLAELESRIVSDWFYFQLEFV